MYRRKRKKEVLPMEDFCLFTDRRKVLLEILSSIRISQSQAVRNPDAWLGFAIFWWCTYFHLESDCYSSIVSPITPAIKWLVATLTSRHVDLRQSKVIACLVFLRISSILIRSLNDTTNIASVAVKCRAFIWSSQGPCFGSMFHHFFLFFRMTPSL